MPHAQPLYPYHEESLLMSTPGVVSAPAQTMILLGPENTMTTCPFCKASINTAVKYTITSRTHIAAALWAIVCCCVCVPYLSNTAKNSDHYCPNCQRYLGTYQK